VVSTISLLLGVHAERSAARADPNAADVHAHLSLVALTGVAGVLAGAASMACGEWVSMSTQAEALAGQLAVERSHLLRFPAQEGAEFAAYLRTRGVRAHTAAAVVRDIAAASEGGVENALDIHAVRRA
jgi:VIT1/CCC1 family predicted Fe2+/Mn2+ transporter